MKFEKTVRVRTPDGVDHDNVEAAKKHLFSLRLRLLGNATSADFEAAVNPSKDDPMDELVFNLREAIREVYLAAWPRASKGKPRERRTDSAPSAQEMTSQAGSEDDGAGGEVAEPLI